MRWIEPLQRPISRATRAGKDVPPAAREKK